jgi:hypothetical protein
MGARGPAVVTAVLVGACAWVVLGSDRSTREAGRPDLSACLRAWNADHRLPRRALREAAVTRDADGHCVVAVYMPRQQVLVEDSLMDDERWVRHRSRSRMLPEPNVTSDRRGRLVGPHREQSR